MGFPRLSSSTLASHTPDCDSPSPTNFNTGTSKNDRPATTAHQQEPVALSPCFYLVASTRQIPSTCSTQESLLLFFSHICQCNPQKWFQELSNGSTTQEIILETLIQENLSGNTRHKNLQKYPVSNHPRAINQL